MDLTPALFSAVVGLVGAVFGGLVAGRFMLAAEDRRASRDRAFARNAIGVTATRGALMALADYLRKGDFEAALAADEGHELVQRVERLVDIDAAETLLLRSEATDRWHTLVDLVTQLRSLSVAPTSGRSNAPAVCRAADQAGGAPGPIIVTRPPARSRAPRASLRDDPAGHSGLAPPGA